MRANFGEHFKLTIFGDDYPTPDGTCRRDYLHVVDLAKGHLKAIDYAMEHTGAEAFNLGTGHAVSVLELVNTFMEATGVNVPYVIGPRREGDLPHGLQALFDQQDMSKSALAKASGISEVYLHQVFSGRRTPSRDRLLCLCIGLGASTEETQSLLQQAHHAPLYARDKRDAVLLFGLSHSLTLPEINDALFTAGAETLL